MRRGQLSTLKNAILLVLVALLLIAIIYLMAKPLMNLWGG